MDIAGAKALKDRLGSKGTEEAPPVPVDPDVPEDAPPVYHWTGVARRPPETTRDGVDDEKPAEAGTSLFRRLGLSFR